MTFVKCRSGKVRYTILRIILGYAFMPLLLATPVFAYAVSTPDVATQEKDDDYFFLGGLELASPVNKGSLARFNRPGNVEPGTYSVDIFLNSVFRARQDTRFEASENASAQACFTRAQLAEIGLSAETLSAATAYGPEAGSEGKAGQCLAIGDVARGALANFDLSALKLSLTVPQSVLNSRPRGYIDPKQFDAGSTMGFVNYSASQYYSKLGGQSNSSTYVSTNSGVNFGMWRLRQQGSIRYDVQGLNWEAVRIYAKRALPDWRSELSLGENYTAGMFFSGMGYQGIELASDDRMLPESQRGYAPLIRGNARTNAQVIVAQKGREIYRTTVPPGPFDIKDLFPTSYNGDLDVVVVEADGTRSQFSVPFSAVPTSMRAGMSRYNLTLGRTRDTAERNFFADAIYQFGISNSLTANTGLRVASGYQSLALGGTHADSLGAVGLSLNYSRAALGSGRNSSGWMGGVTYSRAFQTTGTTFSIASYHYSTSGYRELGDVFGERKNVMTTDGDNFISTTHKQRSRFDVALSQQLGHIGSLYLSGLTQNYYDSRSRVTQLQMGFSTVFRDMSFNVAVQRQQMTFVDSFASPWGGAGMSRGTSIVLSLSIPLGSMGGNRPTVSSSVTRSEGFNVYQTSLSGTAGARNDVNYGVDVSQTPGTGQGSISGNVGTRLPNASVNANVSRGRGYWQAAATARGAFAVHAGGVTFGPYLGDTFALIEAPGASGAKVFNGQGAKVDSSGYALVPSLVPYRQNSVGLASDGMSSKAELTEGQRMVVPYAGASLKVHFKTRQGNALLIQVKRTDGNSVPMGADVLNDEGVMVGMVGQGSQAYVRSDKLQGRLIMRWGDGRNDHCNLQYDVQDQDQSQPLIRFKGICAKPLEMSQDVSEVKEKDQARKENQ